jgi:hypothetical protein
LIELAQGSPGRALHMSREEQILLTREAEELWEALKIRRPALSKATRATRDDIEERIHGLLIPATRALRAGDRTAAPSVEHLQKALTQLRQNVQTTLVYDNLLLQLARGASRRPLQVQ